MKKLKIKMEKVQLGPYTYLEGALNSPNFSGSQLGP